MDSRVQLCEGGGSRPGSNWAVGDRGGGRVEGK